MPGRIAVIDRAIAVTVVGTTNVLGYLSDVNIGVIVTGITAFGGAAGWAVAKIAETKAAARIKIAEAEASAYETEERAKIRVQAEWDQVNAKSLSAQIKELHDDQQKAAARVEEANKKLHDLRNERNAVEIRHREEVVRQTHEIERQTHEIERMSAELAELRAQNRELVEQNRKLGVQNGELMRQNREILAKFDAVQGRIESNSAAIDRIAENTSGESGSHPAV